MGDQPEPPRDDDRRGAERVELLRRARAPRDYPSSMEVRSEQSRMRCPMDIGEASPVPEWMIEVLGAIIRSSSSIPASQQVLVRDISEMQQSVAHIAREEAPT